MFAYRVFPTHDELVYKFKNLRNRVTSITMRNSRISKISPGQVGILVGKWPFVMEKHSGSLCSRGHISQAQARLLTRFVTLWRRHHRLSRDTKIIKNQHRELHQLCAGKSMKVRKACWKCDAFFLPGDHLRAQSLPNSLRVDSQVWNIKKEGNSGYDMKLLVRQ